MKDSLFFRRIIPGTYPATNTDDAAFDDADDYDSADLPDTTAMPSTAPGRTFTSTGIRTRGGITKGTRGAACKSLAVCL